MTVWRQLWGPSGRRTMPVPKAIALSRLPAIPLASSPGSPPNSSAIRSVSLTVAFRIASPSIRKQYSDPIPYFLGTRQDEHAVCGDPKHRSIDVAYQSPNGPISIDTPRGLGLELGVPSKLSAR